MSASSKGLEAEDIAKIVEECYRSWRRAEEMLERLFDIAVKEHLDRYREIDPDLSAWYDDEFEPLWDLEDKGYVRFHWMGRKLYVEVRIHKDGRVECITRERK